MSFEKLSEDQSSYSSEVFLDTSIHCSKLKGSLFQERISNVLRLFRWKGTSSYTKVEFGNVVLSVAEYDLRLLEKYNSLEKTLDHVNNILISKFHSNKIMWTFNLLKTRSEDDVEATERAKLYLRQLLLIGVRFVEDLCDRPLENGTDCYWARRGVHKKRSGQLVWQTPKCKRNNKRCRVDEFFEDNIETFKKIKEAIDSLSEEHKSPQLRGFSDVIGKAMTDPQLLLDYSNGCKKLADAIIAVESICYKSLFSQNSAESELLTRVLGQAFYYLPPNPEKGVLVQYPIVDVKDK